MTRTALAAMATALLSAPTAVVAQDEETSTVQSTIEAILGAINLPQVVEEARQEGVSDSTLVTILDDMRRGRVPATEAEDVMEQEVEVIRAGGPVDNFGAFVQGALAAGLRGRDLAQAIRAEHRSRGIGVPERRPDRDRVRRGGRGPTDPGGNPGRGRGNAGRGGGR